MSKNNFYNTIKNQIKTIFKAPEKEMRHFVSVKTKIITVGIPLTLLAMVVLPALVSSKQPDNISFGRTEVVNVFPGNVTAAGWVNEYEALLQDLDGEDLYQSFKSFNAAYIPTDENPEVIKTPIPTPAPDSAGGSTPSDSVDLEIYEDYLDETIDLNVDIIEETPPVEEVSESEPLSLRSFQVTNMLTGLFPLAQLTLTETTTDQTEDLINLSEVTIEEPVDEFPEVPVIESLVEEEAPIEESPLEENSLVATSTESQEPVVDFANELSFDGFDTAVLQSGQFVTGLQLRISLAGLPKKLAEGEPIPMVEVLYGTNSNSLTSVGTIVIDEEVSNAINGGYFLFALPKPDDVSVLKDAQVRLRLVGESNQLRGLFVDALWLELDTKIVTREDLLNRGKANQLKHLLNPEVTTLVSDQLNFEREEKPLFNLRYNSQRNALVRGVRSLFGRDLVEVTETLVTHKSEGFIGINPVVTTTKDGLITVELTDEDKKNLRPGSYEVTLTLKEGGATFTDTFNFEWGILTINPDKTEYAVGEVAEISIGALTPNGHTICKANLDLYLIAPNEQIQKVPVRESGLCDGNNVIDVPDFSAVATTTMTGTYEMYLERLDEETGEDVIGFTLDTFKVVEKQELAIRRVGPTRIFPPAPYPMEITVTAENSFSGTLIERVPRAFAISETDADITEEGDEKILTWDISLLSGKSKTVSYQFDAPDISPYLFNLGPAELTEKKKQVPDLLDTGTTTASTTELVTETQSSSFVEHRQWQIASDAVGKMLLFWDSGASVPAGWVCVSCTGGDPFFQRFVVGSSTYNNTGGTATHTHTAAGSVLTSVTSVTESGSGTIAPSGHTHTYTPAINAVSNLPAYQQLRIIRYDTAAGEPATIPAGAIGIFDTASSSLPANWFRYAAQDGRYVQGENTPGTTGGANTHTHTITGTTGASAGAGTRVRGGAPSASGASDTHTHTVSGATASQSNEPPYIDVLFAKLSSDGAPPNGLIAMWDQDVDGGWLNVSAGPSDPFYNRFPRGATTYGATGGAATHAPADVTGINSSAPSATVTGRTGAAGSSGTHTHSVSLTGFSSDNNLPPYVSVVFGKRQGTNPVYEQLSSRWYVNTNGLTPSDAWSSVSGIDLVEKEPITATSTPVKNNDVVRLRMNAKVTNATSTAAGFRLEYTAADVCSGASGWTAVGGVASSSVWRGYDNDSPADGATIPSTLLSSSTVVESYEEDGVVASSPNNIGVNAVGEWDFVLQQNGALAGTNYCFRMVTSAGAAFNSYTHYPQLFTNTAPATTTLEKLFDNEKTVSTLPEFFFISTDTEGNTLHYAIEIDNNYDFSSPTLSRTTISNSAEFENQVLVSDKAPFRQGETIKFTPTTALSNGTTYYWRVRALDPEGSNKQGGWSTIRSFTVDTGLVASAWYQTENEQFNTDTRTGVQSAAGSVSLISGSTTGSLISTQIDFNDGSAGTAWGNLTFNDTETTGSILYQLQYLDETETWTLISDTDLPGNSTGFGTSPVSLLNLDTDTYTRIRLVANFTNSGGSPSLQDWTVNWGYRVATPSISKPFSSEQVGTTTPTFEFTTTDPQGDSLTYQIEWAPLPTFGGSTVRTSDANAGFANIDIGGDTDPFNSGDTIQFTIQPADALTGTTTYWWRVRAKDTTGSNAYSFWTEPRSFTVIPGTDKSTWFQTTEEQFASNILSGTIALATDVVTVATTANEAMIVYGEGSVNTPRYRQWTGSALSVEGSLLDIGAPVKWAIVEASPTREEYVVATVGTDADVNAQVFTTGAWGNLQEMTINMGSVNARGFDVAYESLSGDAMVAYCDGAADPSYRIWNGSTWSAEGTINLATGNNCEWLQLASHPTSDEIIVLSRETSGGAYEAQVWNGSAWGNSTTLGSIVDAVHEGMALAYEESGNQAVILSSDGNPARFRWQAWNGTAWSGAATQTIGDDLEWATLVSDVGSDEMTLCYQDEDTNIGTAHWTGSAWTWAATDEHQITTGKAKNDPGFACVFEDTAGRSNYEFVTYTSPTQTDYRFWNNSTWSTAAQVNSIGDAITMQLARTGTKDILGIFFDETNDALRFSTWSGSTWSTTQTIETNVSVDTSPFGRPYSVAPRNSSTEGTTIVSPGIDFTEGTGPYWNEFSWNDSQPGTSDILYYLQYQTAPDTWAFIPNAALAGNESGFASGPIDLSTLNTATYQIIRPYAELTCDGSGNCPSISDWKVEWAGGITVSGTAKQYDESTNVTSGTVAVAVNGVLQLGKTAAISAGVWSIDNVTAFAGDVITVFISGAADANEAVGVSTYDGAGDMDGFELFERHVSLGSNTSTTTALTNANIGLYDNTNTEDIFANVSGTTLSVCAEASCTDAALYIKAGTYYAPGGRIISHDFENNGYFTAGAFTHELSGSWDNNATTTMTGSTIVFSATSTTETIDSTGAAVGSFNNVTFGTTTGSGTWNLSSLLDVDGSLTVSRGTLARGTTAITVGGTLTTGANGLWTGIGTTTLDGNTAANWNDQNATLQNIGNVVVDGVSKFVTLAGNVAAESITIGSNDTLDVSVTNYDITVYSDWNNLNNFVARAGDVFFAGTTGGDSITTGGDDFYNLNFTGAGGSWAFTEANQTISNDLIISNGILTMPTGTTTIAGSFNATGGQFAHNNGTFYFTSATSETITLAGGAFTNVLHNATFNGGGTWSMSDANATTTNDFIVQQGTVNFPTGVLAIGGSLADTGGVFNAGTGVVRFYGAAAETITMGGSSFYTVDFDGAGNWSFTEPGATATNDVWINSGTLTLPTGTFFIGGSYDNNATVNAPAGTLQFNSVNTGETIDFGGSTLNSVIFNSVSGGFTVLSSATTTNNFTLENASDWTLQSGQSIYVGNTFENHVGGASTTWTGTTLTLAGGAFNINDKTDNGDAYNTLVLNTGAKVDMWNSSAATYNLNGTASLYSKDHSAVDGDLYIFGQYTKTGGNEYWTYATDFDGTDLTGGNERQVSVNFAASAQASLTNTVVEIGGNAAASTTIANQGSGTYTVTMTGGTLDAQHYSFADLGLSGLSLLGSTTVTTLRDGSHTVAANTGTALTVSAATIDTNIGKQIYNIDFSTSTAITATNVTQTGGTPASYWWFRDGSGNLYGEDFDSDTGDPGSIRFDDSSLVLTISGTVFSDAGITPITGALSSCDGSTAVVRVVVDGGASYTGVCSDVDGTYSIGGVVVTGDPTIIVYLDNASGGEKATTITRTPTADITNLDLYTNRVIVRNEDIEALTIANLATYDQTDDSDLQFIAATSSFDTLTVLPGNELFIFASSTFTPGGAVTLSANAGANSYDGTLYLDAGATFNTYATTTLTIGGRLELEAGASFSAASSTVLMNATTTGKSITAPSTVTFNELVFNGTGGGWNMGADIVVLDEMTITAGTVTGTGDITIPTGNLTGNGILSLGAGTTTLGSTNTLGGSAAWTFYNLSLGDGVTVGTTTPVFAATTTVAGTLTIQNAHYLDAGSTDWDLSGTGTVFVETGTFLEDTSTIRYSGAGSNVISTTYYDLLLDSGAGTQTYVADAFGIQVNNNLTIGGTAASSFDVNTNDPLLDVRGDLAILSNGTLSASDSTDALLSGDYLNTGTFNGNGGTVVFNAASSQTLAAGSSSFSSVVVDGTGTLTVTGNATATNWTIENTSGFTLDSSQTLAVGGTFFNAVGGGSTTWTGSTLSLYGGGNYSINASSTADSYGTLEVLDTTQIRAWNTDASTYTVAATASLYSQDHASVDGDLYVYGSYQKSTGADYWSYATDFDGTALSGSSRAVDVYVASGGSVTYLDGSLQILGSATASTSVQNQGSGTYSMTIGGTASTSMSYYNFADLNSAGLVFSGTPTINTISNGDFAMSQTGGTAITVGGTVITANPAKTFTNNDFSLDGAASGFNVTATGTSVSSWRFTNHTGDIAGEAFDVDPDGDPGYVVWDNSAANITISGTVYTDDGVTIAGAPLCDGSTQSVRIVVAGVTSYTASCTSGTGVYSATGVSYSPGDSVIAYLTPITTEVGATVTKGPISNITNFDIYQNRVIVRHENTDPITIADMAVYDSSDDADIPFTAVDAGTDTLTLPAGRKLVVWNNKDFAPGGDVTLTGGAGTINGTLQLRTNSIWTGTGSESLTIGGSFISDAGADFNASNGTTTFTSTASGRTIDTNQNSFNNISFTGTGSWSVTDATLTTTGDLFKTAGTLTLPSGTSTIAGSFVQSGGTFSANGGILNFTGSGAESIQFNGSEPNEVIVNGGTYTMTDTNATITGSFTINTGSVTLVSGNLAIGGDFLNQGGTIAHNTSDLYFTNATSSSLKAGGSDLYGAYFSGGGSYGMLDASVTFLDNLTITSGNLTLATGTIAVGGSFDAASGTFDHSSSTLLFNSADAGETINPGVSDFYNVQIAAPTGGYTLLANATTTNNFSLLSAVNFTVQTGVTLLVEGVFNNTTTGGASVWNGGTLSLQGANAYTINNKTTGSAAYDTLIIGENSDIRMWNSSATTTTVASTASLYSQDHSGTNGLAQVYGDFRIGTTTEYWSYATDFDGSSLSGSERLVTVRHAENATTTVSGGTLRIIGTPGNETTVTNQGAGGYDLLVTAGTLNAQYYKLRSMNGTGLTISGTPTIASLAYGDFELVVDGGSLISLTPAALNANASLVIPGTTFNATTSVTGYNVDLDGTTANAWTFTTHSGNLDGEDFDIDGATECGSLRWSDSSCLLTQQTHYRWRNDDGDLGVHSSEWYDTSWDARKRVRVVNENAATTANAAVQLFVTYDSDMQADFEDLRFTSVDGVTLLSYWIGSSTNSVAAEVWVKIPSLVGEETTDIFMYYNNPAATSSVSADDTFAAADDFEDNDIAEYSGQTSLFTTTTNFNFDGAYGLDNSGNPGSRANTGGIYRNDQTVTRGETFRFMQYVDTTAGSSDEVCTLFGVQSASNNYAICLEQFGTDRVSLVKNAVDNDASGTILASSTVTYSTGWYEIEVEWNSDNSFDVLVKDSTGATTTSFTGSDGGTPYTSGGIGFTFWFHNGGWDSVHSRPTLEIEPTILFGVEQLDGGASWKAALDTSTSYDVNDVARLRVAIENSGLAITGQQLLLEYAAQGVAPSCEAVDAGDYLPVPPQASCGSSPLCMVTSSFVTNGASTVDLLTGSAGTFTPGEAREDPSNKTASLNIGQSEYTEVEYVLTPTINTVDENLCFRVTNDGSDYDTYLSVGKMNLQFDPVLASLTLNGGIDISLLPGATTTVTVAGTVTDANGYADIAVGTSTFYRGGVGAACTPDNNSCYVASGPACIFTNCAGSSCDIECSVDMYFHTDPTDFGTYAGEEWFAFVEVEDVGGGYDGETSIAQEVETLRAIDVIGPITYAAVEAGNDTSATNASTSVLNLGNLEVNIEVQGTDLSDGLSSLIPANQQKFATSTFTYGACGSCSTLSSSIGVELDVELAKPVTDSPLITDEVYWGIAVPLGTNSIAHQGINVFTPVDP